MGYAVFCVFMVLPPTSEARRGEQRSERDPLPFYGKGSMNVQFVTTWLRVVVYLADIPRAGVYLTQATLLRVVKIGSIFNVFGNILQPTMQGGAQFIQRFGFDIIVGFQSTHRLTVDSAVLAQPIGTDPLLLHQFPQLIKPYHLPSPLR